MQCFSWLKVMPKKDECHLKEKRYQSCFLFLQADKQQKTPTVTPGGQSQDGGGLRVDVFWHLAGPGGLCPLNCTGSGLGAARKQLEPCVHGNPCWIDL